MFTRPSPGTPERCERVSYVVGFQEDATCSDVSERGGAAVGIGSSASGVISDCGL